MLGEKCPAQGHSNCMAITGCIQIGVLAREGKTLCYVVTNECTEAPFSKLEANDNLNGPDVVLLEMSWHSN